MITDVLFLKRGSTYHFLFAEYDAFDALLLDCDMSPNTDLKKMCLYKICNGTIDVFQYVEIPNEKFIGANPIEYENNSQILDNIFSQVNTLRLSYSENSIFTYEEDIMDAIERTENEAAASQLVHDAFSENEAKAFQTIGSIVNNMPFMLKRASKNKLAFIVLFSAMIQLIEHVQWMSEPFSLPIFPNQEDLFAPENVSMLRQVGYQVRYQLEPKIRVDNDMHSRRYIGYIQAVQKSNQRGLILFAGTTNLPFKFNSIADARLIDIINLGINEVGGIEVQFSIGYMPTEGGERVKPCCIDIVLTENGLMLCKESNQRITFSEEFRLFDEYRINPICPTSYLPDEWLIVPNRLIREGSPQHGDGGIENRLFSPMGTKKGKIVRFGTKNNSNNIKVSEGEIACEGNAIHFNLFQVIDAELYDLLEHHAEKCIGIEVEFELAFNAAKNALSIWADVIRLANKAINIPPEYDSHAAWSVERSQQAWERGEGVPAEYRALQPWLPIMNSLLDNCAYGTLDTSSLSSVSATNNAASFSVKGRIYLDNSRAKWCNFNFSSIAERYLLSLLMSSLRYKIAENSMESNIRVIFSPQPSSTPGRYIADWVLLTALGRSGIRKKIGSDNISCPKNRDASMLIDIADGFIPFKLWGKPKEMQSNIIQQLDAPDIFSKVPYAGVITSLFANQGIIIDSSNNATFPFSVNQIAERSLRESIIGETRYSNISVSFLKRQAPIPKKQKMTSPIIAENIVKGTSCLIESDCEMYRSIIDEILTPTDGSTQKSNSLKLGEAAENAVLEKRKKGRDKSVRVGEVVGFKGGIYTLVDDHPTLWNLEGKLAPFVCTHMKFDISRVADKRLLEMFTSAHTDEYRIKVRYSLVRVAQEMLPQADNICLLADENNECVVTEDFVPLGKALEDLEIEEAVRYHGTVTANAGPCKIFIRLTEDVVFQAQGFEKQIDFHTCTNKPSNNRYYIMDESLQSALEARQIGMKVSFIPTVSFKAGRPPEASFVLLDEGTGKYIDEMPEKQYVENTSGVSEQNKAVSEEKPTKLQNTQENMGSIQTRSTFSNIIDAIPFLAVMSVEQSEVGSDIYSEWLNSQNSQRRAWDYASMLKLASARELSSGDRHRFVCALMNAMLMDAESRKLSVESEGSNKVRRLLSAAYLYCMVIKLYYQELDSNKSAWSKEETGQYLEFPKQALSFFYGGTKLYNAKKDDWNRRLQGYRRRYYDWIWESARDWDIGLTTVPEFNDKADNEWNRKYVLVLLQSVWLSGKRINEFLTDKERGVLYSNNSPWKGVVDQLCKEFDSIPTGLDELSNAFNNQMNALRQVIPDLSGQKVEDLVSLGDLQQSHSVLSIIKQMAGGKNNWILDSDSSNDWLGELDSVRKALENPKISDQVDSLKVALDKLKTIRSNFIENPSFSSHLLLHFINNAVDGIKRQLISNMQADVKPSLKAAQCSVNLNRELIVAVEISSELYSLKRSGISLKPSKVPQCISIVEDYPSTFDLSSGEKRTFEFKFRINEDLSRFRARGAVEIVFGYTSTVNKYSKDGYWHGETITESNIKLNCLINSERQSITAGVFNPSSTSYTEAKYNSATKAQFVGREDELKKLKEALFDESTGCYRSGVGMTIAGRRRTGKSWLAGRFCEILREEGDGQIIVCDKIDVYGIDRPGDLTEKILQSIINAHNSLKPFAQEIYGNLKPTIMLQHLAERLGELQRYDLKDQVIALLDQLNDEGVQNTVSFSAFFSELSNRYQEKHGCEIPPILITLDEFTSSQDKIVRGKISRDEILSIIKLTEVYRVNILLICADNFESVRTFIDQNAFTHYKTNVWVDGIQEQETIQMLCRRIPVELAGKERTLRKCIDDEVARQLHRWYDGNVFLIATAAEFIIQRMNTNGYIYFEPYHLRFANFAQALLRATTKEEFLQAYIEDGRFLDDQYPALVLRWLNIQAMACIAENGGRNTYSEVLQRVRYEYQLLFRDKDNSRLINILRSRYEVTSQELPQIAQHIIERFSPIDVINWLKERGVFKIEGDNITLPLKAYIEARKNPDAECLRLEIVDDYAADTADIPTDEEVEDPDFDFDD